MEKNREGKPRLYSKRFGASALLATSLALSTFSTSESVSAEHKNEGATITSAEEPQEWQLDWKDDFTSQTLSSRWKVIDNNSEVWDRFSQYRQHGVKLRNRKLIISSRRHCVVEGDELTLFNTQQDPCPEGLITQYSSGRVEQVVADITGDYKVEVTAKLPLDEGARVAIWANNLADDKADPNAGYCYEGGPPTDTAEPDLLEYFGDNVARASHHVRCENGEMPEVSRAKRFKPGWAKKLHLFAVEKIGNHTTFFVDGEPMPILGSNKKIFTDSPQDFDGVTKSEYLQAYFYPLGTIFDTRVFTGNESSSEKYNEPRPDLPFTAKELKIDSIRVYK